MPSMNKLSNYATTISGHADLMIVTYHKTQIVAFDSRNITLRTGGWDTVTTRRKMNQASNQFGLGFGVYRQNGVSYVNLPNGETVELVDNMTFSRG